MRRPFLGVQIIRLMTMLHAEIGLGWSVPRPVCAAGAGGLRVHEQGSGAEAAAGGAWCINRWPLLCHYVGAAADRAREDQLSRCHAYSMR